MSWQIPPVAVAALAGIVAAIHLVRFRSSGDATSVARAVVWSGVCVTYVYVALSATIAVADSLLDLVSAFIFVIGVGEVTVSVVRIRASARGRRVD